MKIIPLCMVYKILHNEFYTGYFEYPPWEAASVSRATTSH